MISMLLTDITSDRKDGSVIYMISMFLTDITNDRKDRSVIYMTTMLLTDITSDKGRVCNLHDFNVADRYHM
jgi:hypothetical protein